MLLVYKRNGKRSAVATSNKYVNVSVACRAISTADEFCRSDSATGQFGLVEMFEEGSLELFVLPLSVEDGEGSQNEGAGGQEQNADDDDEHYQLDYL